MTKRKIFFRADASATIGYGHFIRTLALADMLKEDFDCTFFTQSPTEYQINEVANVCKLFSLPADNSHFNLFLEILNGDEIVVLDNYFFTTDYQRNIKKKGCKLVCVDDMHNKHYVADAIINHGPVTPDEFDCESYTRLYLGDGYKLLRAPFRKQIQHTKRNNTAIINLGGADPFRLTDKLVSLLLQTGAPYHIVVILGDNVTLSKENKERVKVCRMLTAEQMAELFETSAFAILPGSTVSIEAMSRGIPLLIGYQVDNQEEGYKKTAGEGKFIPLGNLHQLSLQTMMDAIRKLDGYKQYHPDYSMVEKNFRLLFKSL